MSKMKHLKTVFEDEGKLQHTLEVDSSTHKQLYVPAIFAFGNSSRTFPESLLHPASMVCGQMTSCANNAVRIISFLNSRHRIMRRNTDSKSQKLCALPDSPSVDCSRSFSSPFASLIFYLNWKMIKLNLMTLKTIQSSELLKFWGQFQ